MFNKISPFLATLELNRIQLLSKIEEQGRLWKTQQAVIDGFIEAQNNVDA